MFAHVRYLLYFCALNNQLIITHMKRLFFLLALFSAATVFAHTPVFGHRGGIWGVENTEGCYIAGAQVFDGLETDTKVTKDSIVICCHDADFSLLGGHDKAASNIRSHTLAELRKFKLKQTTPAGTFTDSVCTFERYIQICKEYKVIAMVEIKWCDNFFTTNSTAGMPLVFDILKKYDMLDHCIIMSSIKPCLEWVRAREEYNHIPVQLLGFNGTAEDSWNNLTAWAAAHYGDIDPECYQITNKALVTNAHKDGIKVACWNVTNTASYIRYRDMGVDYITADSLRTQFLPDYTPNNDFIDVEYKNQFLNPIFDSLVYNPYGWHDKGDLAYAFQQDYNEKYSTTYDWVKMDQDSVVYYHIGDQWIKWDVAEAQKLSYKQTGFLADQIKDAQTLVTWLRSANTPKWNWLYRYINKRINASNRTNLKNSVSAFFLCSPAKEGATDVVDMTEDGKYENFWKYFQYLFCPRSGTAIQEFSASANEGNRKFIQNGQLVIESNHQYFNALGHSVTK